MSASRELAQPLVEAVGELSLARNLEEMARSVCRWACDLVEADSAAFVLRDGYECFSLEEPLTRPDFASYAPLGRDAARWSMLNGQQAVVTDVCVDTRVPAKLYESAHIRSLVTTPVDADAPLAVIGTFWTVQHFPTDDETAVLRSLSQEAAAAMRELRTKGRIERRVASIRASPRSFVGERADHSVLLIMSDAGVRASTALLLRMGSYEVHQAEGLEDLRETLPRLRSLPSVVVSELPFELGELGLEAIALVRTHFAFPIPAVVLAEGRDSSLARLQSDAWTSILEEPAAIEVLWETIAALIARAAENAARNQLLGVRETW